MFINRGVQLISLSPNNHEALTKHAKEFNLNFDDAYQYQIADNYDLTLVSYDRDFDGTKSGRIEPGEIIS